MLGVVGHLDKLGSFAYKYCAHLPISTLMRHFDGLIPNLVSSNHVQYPLAVLEAIAQAKKVRDNINLASSMYTLTLMIEIIHIYRNTS